MRREHLSGGTRGTGAMATGTRSNALWGKGRRRYPLLVFTFVVVAASVVAGSTRGRSTRRPSSGVVPDSLRDKAKAHPKDTFHVVIQTSDPARSSTHLGAAVGKAQKKHPGKAKGLKKKFKLIGSVAAEVTGDQIADLAAADGVVSVTEDAPIQATALRQPAELARDHRRPVGRRRREGTDYPDDRDRRLGRPGAQRLRQAAHQAGRLHDHGQRELAGATASGTARSSQASPPAAPTATRASSRAPTSSRSTSSTTRATGRVSDVLAACDWILQNKDKYNIDVANFSINAGERRGRAERPARQGGREAVAERRRRRRGSGQLRGRRGRERRRLRARQRPVRDHGRRLRHERHRDADGRLRGPVVGVGTDAGRLPQAGARGARAAC